MEKLFKEPVILILLFFSILFIYAKSPTVYPVADSKWCLHTAMSIITEFNTDLDEYRELTSLLRQHATEEINGKRYSVYPIGTSIIAIPILYPVKLIIDRFSAFYTTSGWTIKTVRLNDRIKVIIPVGIEQFIASFYTALTALVIFLIASIYLNKKMSAFLSLIFAFATAAWPTASRALWQHTPTLLMLSLALYLYLKSEKNPYLSQFVSLPLAFAFISRPTSGLSVLIFTILVFMFYRRFIWKYLLWASIIAIPFLLFNITVYHHLFSPYYQQKLFSASNVWVGLAGNLISPSRGLFIYTPLFILCFWGIYLKIKNKEFNWLDLSLIIIFFLHWISISVWYCWYGGHCYGYRLFSDIIPYLLFFLIPVLKYWLGMTRIKKIGFSALFWLLTIISVFMNYQGAAYQSTLEWHIKPNNTDVYQERHWDWKRPPFLIHYLGFGKEK